jgi:hypothetical protein
MQLNCSKQSECQETKEQTKNHISFNFSEKQLNIVMFGGSVSANFYGFALPHCLFAQLLSPQLQIHS